MRFNILVGTHILTLAVAGARQFVEQAAIHIVTDTKREDTRSHLVDFARVLDDLWLTTFARCGKSISQKNDVRRALVVLQLVHRRLQCTINVCASTGIDALHITERFGSRLIVVALKFRFEALNTTVVGNDVEQIAWIEIVQHKLERPFGLLNFFATHAARSIDHKHDRLRERLVGGTLDLGTD